MAQARRLFYFAIEMTEAVRKKLGGFGGQKDATHPTKFIRRGMLGGGWFAGGDVCAPYAMGGFKGEGVGRENIATPHPGHLPNVI